MQPLLTGVMAVAPILSVGNSSLVAISTLTSEINFYTRLIKSQASPKPRSHHRAESNPATARTPVAHAMPATPMEIPIYETCLVYRCLKLIHVY